MITLHFNHISAECYIQAMDKENTVFNLQNQPMYTVYTQQYNFYPSYRFQQRHHHHQGEKTPSYLKHVQIYTTTLVI